MTKHPSPKFIARVFKEKKTGCYGYGLIRYDFTPSQTTRPVLIITSGRDKTAAGNWIMDIYGTYEEAYKDCRTVCESKLKSLKWDPENPEHIEWPPENEPVEEAKPAA